MAEVMLVDWLDDSFPKQVPGDYELDKEDDTNLVQSFLNNNNNCFKFFHQLGVLETWLKRQTKALMNVRCIKHLLIFYINIHSSVQWLLKHSH